MAPFHVEPKLKFLIQGLQTPVGQLEVLLSQYENRLRDKHELRTGDAVTDYGFNSERDQLLTEMALASTLLIQLKASIETGKEVLG